MYLKTGAEYIIYGQYVPNEILKIISDIEIDRMHRSGHVFDLIVLLTIDAIIGFGTGVGNQEAVQYINVF